MLSVLIPVYNYNITSLVGELHRQLADALVDFEIIVMEDGSTLFLQENETVGALSNCLYIPLEKNIGRSAVRNKLGDMARYEHLLFMDCDAKVLSPNYIANYLAFRNEECVVSGGTAYDGREHNPAYSLRLKYGREREASLAHRREDRRYKVLTTFNFMISKSIFQRIHFDETICGYGYEDTVFGHRVVELGYDLMHIDNPLIHMGLDENAVFLRKTETGVRNLYALYCTGRYPYLPHESKLLHTFIRMKRFGMTWAGALLYRCFRGGMRRNLLSSAPSLRMFDLYKLLFMCNTSCSK